ncbi:MAG TPA: DUF4064 domain-containing protein [Virgibacillus sp.]|nr:DUF4064 domain-containing protein [Virgibacillus sp.]
MNRTAEFVLGLIGGIFGIIAAIMAIFIGGIGEAFGAEGSGGVTVAGWLAVLLSVLGIIGSTLVRSRAKVGGILMVIAAVGGFISIFMFYLLSGILLLIGGLMALFKQEVSE